MLGWITSLFRHRKRPVAYDMPLDGTKGHHPMLVGSLVDTLMDIPRTWQVECVRVGGTEISTLAAVEVSDGKIRFWSRS